MSKLNNRIYCWVFCTLDCLDGNVIITLKSISHYLQVYYQALDYIIKLELDQVLPSTERMGSR